MSTPTERQPGLLELAALELLPVLDGCAAALRTSPEGGGADGKAANRFGPPIVGAWSAWFRSRPPEVRQQALADLAALSPEDARREAGAAMGRAAPDANPEDRSVAAVYLSLLPGAVDRALLPSAAGPPALPPTVSVDDPQQLLQFLPLNLPPYPVPGELPGTPYRLEALLGSGGFGAVYRATTHSLQHLPLAIKFCLDPTLTAALHRERSNLERLMKASREGWSARIVRLYGYDLEYRTPYLVYEYVAGGDLTRHLALRRQQAGRLATAEEVLGLVVQVVEALSFAHKHGLVHRDLKPANVLVEGDTLKLADFGLGGVTAGRAVQVSRIGATTLDLLSVADQASLFRGAGTPLYMAPEQRRGAGPDPRHDLYSLGVLWYQFLVGDVTRELHPGWAKELTVRFQVPRSHLDLIERCVGWVEDRPRDAGELLPLLQALRPGSAPAAVPVAAPAAEAPPGPGGEGEELRQALLASLVKRLDEAYRGLALLEQGSYIPVRNALLAGVLGGLAFGGLFRSEPAFVLGFLLIGGVTGGVLHLVWLGRRGDLRDRVAQAVQLLSAEFPDAVRSWGGDTVLRNAETVRQVAERLGVAALPAPATEAAAPELPALEPGQRKQLAGQLRQVAQAHAEAARYAARKPFPLAVALIVGLLLGAGAGVGLGLMYLGYAGPLQSQHYPTWDGGATFNWPPAGWENHPSYRAGKGGRVEPPPAPPRRPGFDRWGRSQEEPAYRLSERTTQTTAVTLGVLGGFLVAAGAAALLAWLRWYRWQLLGGVALGVALGGAAGAGVGFLIDGLWSPYNAGGKFFDSRGVLLSFEKYQLERRVTTTTAVLAGVGSGVVLTLAVAGLYLGWYARQASRARQALRERLQELAGRFPQVVQAWGGADALTERETAERLAQVAEAPG